MHYIPFMPENMFEAIAAAAVSGTVMIESDDAAYQAWAQAMSDYAGATNAEGLPSVGFWLVVRLNSNDFSDTLEMHQKLPMMIPREGSGALIGLARTQEELDALVSADTDKYVYLTYKIKLQGQHAWRTLLEFMGEHNMLDKQDP